MDNSSDATCPMCNAKLVARSVADGLVVCGACGELLPDDTQVSRMSTKAQLTMLLGILSVVFSFLAALPAVVLGAVALGEIHRQPDRLHGKGLAFGGMGLALLVTLVNGGCVAWMLQGPVTEYYGELQDVVIVPAESRWTWLHPADGTDPATHDEQFHSTFYLRDFDDSNWNSDRDRRGPSGGFGYGDMAEIHIGEASGNVLTTAYFRHVFSTNRRFTDLYLTLQRDDGVIVYLDGVEVARDNVKEGPDTFDLLAETTTSGELETHLHRIDLAGMLSPGEHVLAISLHNRGAESSDLRIAEISLHGRPAR